MAPARLLLALLLLTGGTSPALAADPARYMTAELIAESLSPAPGSTILVGVRMRPRPGWHGYWSNPGDAGFAPTIRWSAANGVTFGPLLHPAPKLISAAGISSYVHEGEHVLLSRMAIPSGLAPGTPIPVAARASWAACTATMCVPLQGTLKLDLTVGNGAKGPDSPALTAARLSLPRPARGGTFSSDGKSVRLLLPAGVRLDPRRTRFFPDDNDAFETARGRVEQGSSGLVVTGPARTGPGRPIGGVVTDGRTAYRLSFALSKAGGEAAKPASPVQVEAAVPPPATAPVAQRSQPEDPAPARQDEPARSLWPWLLLATAALAGGVLVRRAAKPKRT